MQYLLFNMHIETYPQNWHFIFQLSFTFRRESHFVDDLDGNLPLTGAVDTFAVMNDQGRNHEQLFDLISYQHLCLISKQPAEQYGDWSYRLGGQTKSTISTQSRRQVLKPSTVLVDVNELGRSVQKVVSDRWKWVAVIRDNCVFDEGDLS